MSDQYEFYGGHPPHQPRDTSLDAATEIRSEAATLRGEVFRYILGRGEQGATDEEIQEALEMAGNTERPRRRELEAEGRIFDCGKRRHTKTGRKAAVWVAQPGTLRVRPRAKKPELEDGKACLLALRAFVMTANRAGLTAPEDVLRLGRWLAARYED